MLKLVLLLGLVVVKSSVLLFVEYVHTGQGENCFTMVGIEPATFGLLVQCSVLYQLSWEVKWVPACNISQLDLVDVVYNNSASATVFKI